MLATGERALGSDSWEGEAMLEPRTMSAMAVVLLQEAIAARDKSKASK
jgi:hypothetical protein